MKLNSKRAAAAVAVLTALALGTAGCGSSSDPSSAGSGAKAAPVTLHVSVFGRFGYADLYKKYMAAHPNVKIVEAAEGDLGKYTTALTQRIAAGSGAADVVAIEEGSIIQFLQGADRFVNLQKFGSEAIKSQWLPWKYQQATTADGKTTIGLGTDVGGLAMCYRKDLFAKAGLPTDRDAVAALWPTWDAYIDTGKKFQAGIGDNKVHFIDAATNTYNSILMQTAGQGDNTTYFDKSNTLIIDSNASVKSAWAESEKMVNAGLSAKLKSFSPEWNAAFKNGAFATIACPAWMTGYIAGQAGEGGSGNWDIATVPGGGGNWGGSFLAVPTQSKHQKEAVALVKYLTAPQGQLAAFEAEGNLPSAPSLYEDPALKDAKNPYFSDAPIGQLFVAGAKNLSPVYLGAKNQPVRDAVENALRSYEQGQTSADEAWANAIKDAKAAAGV
ncbi:MAG: cellobiose transport system substrate-binding protein [Kribbellaceae bacterium]|nr:cellobiose transport system substrate-binding protein [Kribbellaceae bacterium]